jgi:sigma-B regulation protein RsbU (phosphoserine phosphatase)
MIRPKTLQQRLVLFLLLPVALLLLGVGAFGFITMRQALLSQWREATIGKLERAAHHVDMRLQKPKELIQMLHEAAGSPNGRAVQDWALQKLKSLEGVADVRTTWLGEPGRLPADLHCEPAAPASGHGPGHGASSSHGFAPCRLEVTAPQYDTGTEFEAVVVHSDFKGSGGEILGRIEVLVRLQYLLQDAVPTQNSDWFKVFLVDDCGEVIFSSTGERTRQTFDEDSLEAATVEATRTSRYGTVLGEGYPPRNVSGFFKLQEAPWTFVLVAPGHFVLKDVIAFRNVYFAVGGGMIVLIILLIRSVAGKAVTAIREVSQAADRVAQGDLEALVHSSHGGSDELARLILSFNSMIAQLHERLRLKEAVNLAQEMQQSLLPQSAPRITGIDLAGRSDFCDETGGDYYDFIRPDGMDSRSVYIAVGDVVGHGLGAALLMTTVRAFLRSRLAMPGSIKEVVAHVNRLLCEDTDRTVAFMTLFLARMDPERSEIRWVRAGHDPGLLYNPRTDAFTDLQGGGVALGIDRSYEFEEGIYQDLGRDCLLVFGTDGIWETENPAGEAFGKDRLKEMVRQNQHLTASDLVQAVSNALDAFRDGAPQTDDATIVVARIEGGQK